MCLNDNEDTLYLSYIIQDVVQGFLGHPFTRFNTAPAVGSNLLYGFIEPQCQTKNRIAGDYVFSTFFDLVLRPFLVLQVVVERPYRRAFLNV